MIYLFSNTGIHSWVFPESDFSLEVSFFNTNSKTDGALIQGIISGEYYVEY